jgi:hypothetical protein
MRKGLPFLCFILISSLLVCTPNAKASKGEPKVGVLYYPWYQEGNGTGHWSNSTWWKVVDEPSFGYYGSLNATVINRQLGAMHAAGIDFILLSWWGNSTWCTLNEDTACHYVFDAIKQNHTDMQAFLMVDDIFANSTNVHSSDYSDIYNYINESYLVPYQDNYFKLNGKPVLGWWACADMTDNLTRRRDWVFNSTWTQTFEVRTIGQHHDYVESFDKNWYGWTPSTSTPDERSLTFGQSDGFIFIEPRYDDTHKYLWNTTNNGTTFFNQNLTGGYELQWQAVLNGQASNNDVNIVCIYSWNSYDERSAIEPEIDFTVPNLDPWYLLNMTRRYIMALKSPRIENVYRMPKGTVQPNENMTVYANVTDYGSGVKNVSLNYTTTWASDWSIIPMTANSSTGLYEATIPGQQANTTLIYSIVVYDNANNSRTDNNNELYYSYSTTPEFSSLLILPLLMFTTALVKVLRKKKRVQL